MLKTYYNEIDSYAAQWLQNLIAAGHIAPGVVDERSIEDIEPAELAGYTQCHFFAGIGVWSLALRKAGWPDDRPVWTGSCPCQPFSSAGKGAGFADERHLWPAFHYLISQCRPPVVFGEQVASKDGLAWLDLVRADLEATGYAAGSADLCAAGVGAPHIRQRLYWVADSGSARSSEQFRRRIEFPRSSEGCSTDGMDNNNNKGLEGHGGRYQAQIGHWSRASRPVAEADESGGLADADSQRHEWWTTPPGLEARAGARVTSCGKDHRPRPTHGHWRDADWLHCRDGKWRPVEPGTFPLAHGATSRVGRLRAYGNAIVPQVAQAFIEAFMECRPC